MVRQNQITAVAIIKNCNRNVKINLLVSILALNINIVLSPHLTQSSPLLEKYRSDYLFIYKI